jgi:hypothetical protein
MATQLERLINLLHSVALGVDDIFAHFTSCAINKTLPEFEDLEKLARNLYRTYSTSQALYRALHGLRESSPVPPEGSPWKPREQTNTAESNFEESSSGDVALACSIAFIRDMMILRESQWATSQGDVGRVYETLKVRLFTFAGSTHSKYARYLFETLCSLELESSPELRRALLQMSVVNITGMDGHFVAGDWAQELHNRVEEELVQKRGKEFGGPFVQNIISRNVHHLGRLKIEALEGVGLCRRTGKHADPHTKPEVRKLLAEYREHELHTFRAGREIDPSRDFDNFDQGAAKLDQTLLKRWLDETRYIRGARERMQAPPTSQRPLPIQKPPLTRIILLQTTTLQLSTHLPS